MLDKMIVFILENKEIRKNILDFNNQYFIRVVIIVVNEKIEFKISCKIVFILVCKIKKKHRRNSLY